MIIIFGFFEKLKQSQYSNMLFRFVIFISIILFLAEIPEVEGKCSSMACIAKCKVTGNHGGYCTSVPDGFCICSSRP